MNELALFAGAGGGILGGLLLGWRTRVAVEIDPYCRSVLLARQRDGILEPFPIWDEIKTFDGRPWRENIDVVSGGFPCVAWSTAARGNNTGENLWPEMLRVIGEVQPRFVLAENVDEGAIAQAQDDLTQCGYTTNRGMLAGFHVGADHPRKRWWLVADSDNKSELGSGINAKMAVKSARRNRLWSSLPDDKRMDDGFPNRMDRLKAIGNSQVPAVAALAWEILLGGNQQ
jgi:DNA (cytosine-5)-methyltransferase 1